MDIENNFLQEAHDSPVLVPIEEYVSLTELKQELGVDYNIFYKVLDHAEKNTLIPANRSHFASSQESTYFQREFKRVVDSLAPADKKIRFPARLLKQAKNPSHCIQRQLSYAKYRRQSSAIIKTNMIGCLVGYYAHKKVATKIRSSVQHLSTQQITPKLTKQLEELNVSKSSWLAPYILLLLYFQSEHPATTDEDRKSKAKELSGILNGSVETHYNPFLALKKSAKEFEKLDTGHATALSNLYCTALTGEVSASDDAPRNTKVRFKTINPSSQVDGGGMFTNSALSVFLRSHRDYEKTLQLFKEQKKTPARDWQTFYFAGCETPIEIEKKGKVLDEKVIRSNIDAIYKKNLIDEGFPKKTAEALLSLSKKALDDAE